jgi:hypothetical protein
MHHGLQQALEAFLACLVPFSSRSTSRKALTFLPVSQVRPFFFGNVKRRHGAERKNECKQVENPTADKTT